MPNIRHLIPIQASPEVVFKAVSTRDGFAAWWTTEVYEKPGEADKLRLHFGPEYYKGYTKGIIEKNKCVTWKCTEGHPEWVGTDLVFNLRPDGEGTKLFFEHNGWTDYTDLYSQCSYDWTIFLRSLKSYCEKGVGKPFPDYQ